MDVLDSLSDIFDDPLLNEFTDKLLNDIDLNELSEVSNDALKLLDRDGIDSNEVNDKTDSDAEEQWEHSNSTTLEALLKSQNPSSCVPPAPDLCSDLTGVASNLVPISTRDNTQINLSSNHRRSSLPLLKPDPGTPLSFKDGVTGVKPRLIRDYLEKCDTDDSLPKQTRRLLIGYANQPYHLGPNASPYEYSVNAHPTNQWHSDQFDLKFDDETTAVHARSKGDERNTRRAPHNAIEKRYRASINGRIDELRKILIPFPTTDAKMNKSAVLRQAIDRIKELEEMNGRLQAEVMTLRSMHSSCGRLHNSSPESGIASFEPSPSSSTNISSLDFGGFNSPPLSSDTSCGSSYHNGVSVPGRSLTNDHSMTFLDALDAKRNTWSMEEKAPHMLSNCDLQALGNTHGPEVSFDDGVDLVSSAEAHHLFVVQPSYDLASFPSARNQDAPYRQLSPDQIPYSMNNISPIASHTNDIHDSATPLVNGYHGKRPLYPVQSGPIKIRRQTLSDTTGNVRSEAQRRPTDLIIPSQFNSKPSDNSTALSNPNSLSLVRQLLCSNSSSTTNALSSQVVESTTQYVHGSASGFNGVAARTTLCVAALCLITLDPSMLTGTGRANTGSGGPTSPSSRRLLSSWSELLSPSNTPWIVWLVYLLQWIAATFLCFWACQKRDLSAVFDAMGRSPPKHRLKSPEVATSWNEANTAATEGAWITADKKLRLCLSKLGSPLPELTGMTKQNLRSQFWYAIRWLKVFTGSLFIGFFHYPRLMWAIWFNGKRDVNPTQSQVREFCHTPAEVRLRLLEVHLLALDHSIDSQVQSLFSAPLERAELILLCTRDFVKSSISILKSGHKRKNPLMLQAESLAKSGFMVSLALNRDSGLPQLIKCFLLRWISRSLNLLPSSNTGPFAQWAVNPLTRSLLVNSSNTQLTCPYWFSSSYGTTKCVLRAVLQQRIMDYCLRALIFEPTKDLSKLEPYIDCLLQLCDPQSSLSSGFSHNPGGEEKAHWWAQFIRTAWFHRTRNPSVPTRISESSMTSMSLNLESPPQGVLNCPQTGCLAESAWLAYCSLQRSQHIGTLSPETLSGAQRAAKLLRTSLLQLKEDADRSRLVSEDSEIMDSLSFWKLACELLIVDWQLSFLSAALLPSRNKRTDQALAQSATFRRALSAFNTSLFVMLKASSLLPATTPDWITKKLSYSEAISRLIFGANPVHSRLVLMHACRNSSSTTSVDIRSRALSSTSSEFDSKFAQDLSNSNFSKTTVDGDATIYSPSTPISGLLDFDAGTLKDTLPCIRPSRCNMITQSPGQ